MKKTERKVTKISYKLLLLVLLFAMIFFLSLLSPFFLSWDNGLNILNQSAVQLILAVGMTFVICSGGIDLSVGAAMAFSAVIMAMLLKEGAPTVLSILAGLVVGSTIGMFHGMVISSAKINPFIVTLSTMSILRGATILITDGRPIYGFDQDFTLLGSGSAAVIGIPVILALAAAILGAFFLEKTRFGNYCFFFGSNEKALHRCGVRTGIYKSMIFGVSGFCAGLAGVLVTARLNTADPLAGSGYEMDAIAAVILGGTLMQGGKGSIGGTVIACLILNVMKNGLTMLAISSNYQQLLTGAIVLVSVIISEIKSRKNEVMQ